MKQKQYYLGIDLGTSAVKGILKCPGADSRKARQPYNDNTPDGWTAAVKKLLSELCADLDGRIAAIGFSSQVGTYVVNGKDVIGWYSDVALEELQHIKSVISEDEFLREIAMTHPDLISYPLPRLLHITKRYGPSCEVLMPKEILIREFTSRTVTDVFSMRGIANPATLQYAQVLMDRLGIDAKLPPLKTPFDVAGFVTETASAEYGIPCGIPVYLGCNDFFAGLIGMGIYGIADAFDLSGTSEHVGYISEEINRCGCVSGPYFNGFCTYGGTKSSGASCNFAMETFGLDTVDLTVVPKQDTPIFLPYLNGERAPIFDENARGVFFGIGAHTDKAAMAYAVMEGVVFSLYDIWNSMALPAPTRLICGGGSAVNRTMNVLRASVFGCEILTVKEPDTSALGACMIAMTGDGVYRNIHEAIRDCTEYTVSAVPDPALSGVLRKRFEIYKDLYASLKETFKKFSHSDLQRRLP